LITSNNYFLNRCSADGKILKQVWIKWPSQVKYFTCTFKYIKRHWQENKISLTQSCHAGDLFLLTAGQRSATLPSIATLWSKPVHTNYILVSEQDSNNCTVWAENAQFHVDWRQRKSKIHSHICVSVEMWRFSPKVVFRAWDQLDVFWTNFTPILYHI